MAIGYKPAARTSSDEDTFDEERLQSIIGSEIARSVLYDRDGESDKRSRALEYIQGTMSDFAPKKGRSTYTSRDFADTVGWMMPGIMRVFAGSSRICDFQPQGPADEDDCEQAGDWINHQFYGKNDGYKILRNATFDSLTNSYGVVKQYWNTYPETKIHLMTGISEMQIGLLQENGAEILAARPGEQQQAIDPETGQPVMIPTFDIKVRAQEGSGHLCYENVAGEDFFKDAKATDCYDARFLAQRSEPTRSEMVEMGFDQELVYSIPSYSMTSTFREEENARGGADGTLGEHNLHASMEKVELYECFIRIDIDGDGVAESVRAYYAGTGGSGQLLDWEEWDDEWPFDIIPCDPMPYRFEGFSIFDRTEDVQQLKTTLTRQFIDNLIATNVPMIEAEEGTVLNPEALVSPKFGSIVWRKKGSIANSPTKPIAIPFVADKVLPALEFVDTIIEKRTGVSRATMALDPSAYQDQTARSAELQHSAAYSKHELVARDMAELGWKKVFAKSLRIVCKNQDRTGTIRLRDKWVEVDPRVWNANMDCVVNVGFGSGTQEKDIANLGTIYQTQLQIAGFLNAAGFKDRAVALTPKIIRTVTRMAQATGLRDAAGYYPDITEKDVPALMQVVEQQAQQPPPEEKLEMIRINGMKEIEGVKAQANAQIEQMKAQSTAQIEQAKAQMDAQSKLQIEGGKLRIQAEKDRLQMQREANKELAQLQADLKSKQMDHAAKAEEDERKYEYEKWKTASVELNKWDIAVLQANTQLATAKDDEGEPIKAGDDGKIINRFDERHSENRKDMAEVKSALGDLATSLSRKRRTKIIRDQDGRVAGAEDE